MSGDEFGTRKSIKNRLKRQAAIREDYYNIEEVEEEDEEDE